MAIKIRCANCNQKYELDDAMGGRSLACSCGATLEIPVPQRKSQTAAQPADSKSCPSCGAVGPSSNVICVQCGYNFSTGTKIAAAPSSSSDSTEEPTESVLQRFFPLIKLGVIAALVVGVGGGVYVLATTKHHGITAKTPIGTFAKIDGFLHEIRLEKSKEPEPTHKSFGVEGKLYHYTDTELRNKSRGMFTEEVLVVVDAGGKMCAIGASFSPPSEAIPGSGTKIQRFMTSFWDQAGCPPPEFKDVKRQNAFFSWTENVAEVKSDKLVAKWVKGQAPSGLHASSDRVWITLPGLSIDALDKNEDEKESKESKSALPQLPSADSSSDE